MQATESFYRGIGYPAAWLEEGRRYSAKDSYIRYDPSWDQPLPEVPMVSIYELFHRTAEEHRDETALIFMDNEITYGQLDAMINRFAALLLDLGVKPGDYVAPMLPNSPQHWIAFYAAARIGAVHAPINVMYKGPEIAYQVSDCGAKTIVTLDMFYPVFESLKAELDIKHIIVTNIRDFASPRAQVYDSLQPFWRFEKRSIPGTVDLAEAIEKYEPTTLGVECNPRDDVAQIIYTAGTTGRSKGALQTHHNLVFNSISHSLILQTRGKPVNYCVLPMFHTGGFFLFPLTTLYRGGTVITVPVFDPQDAFRIIQQYRVNAIFGSPTLYVGLLRHPGLREHDLTSLEWVVTGAAPVPPELPELWTRTMGIPMHIGWGMTELNTCGTFNAFARKRNPSSIGVPLCAELKIGDDEGAVLPRGETGEILYRGLQVSKGYLNKPDETGASFLGDGWFRTGDTGYMDEDGFVHFVDRKKDLIIASGYNIAPVEIEYAILEHPKVLESAVVGIPDPYRGETVKAFVVLKEEFKGTVGEEEIIAFCRERLGAYKVPRMVEFRDALPKNAIGKTLRRILRAEEAARGQS